MKATKLLKKLEAKVDNLYDALYEVRDVFEDIEDGELDYLINSFVDQIEVSISEGKICVADIQEQIHVLEE